MTPAVHISKDPKKPAGKTLQKVLAENASRPVLLLLCGGSALSILDFVAAEALGPKLTVTALDERYTLDPKNQNLAITTSLPFFAGAKAKGSRFIDPRIFFGTNADIEKAAGSFEKELTTWRHEAPKGMLIAVMGFGADGHIGGILPGTDNAKLFKERFDMEGKEVTAYDTGRTEHRFRLTVTFPFMRRLNHAIVYAVGGEKRTTLTKILAEEGTLTETPARILREIPDAEIFSDIKI